MGLSSKQVSSDMNNWNQALLEAKGENTLEFPNTSPMKRQKQQQQQQQQPEQLKCPRCDSTNTKFCYYNNYNKSQPRHFCKACKRHWTKGGTLRNVPVGGGRKNKRLKLSKTASKSNTTTTTTTTNNVTSTTTLMSGISNHNNNVIEDLSFSKAFYQNFLKQQQCSLPQTTIGLSPYNDYSQEIQLPYSKLASFESNPCSISSTITQIQSPNLYNLGNDHASANNDGLEETIIMNSHDHQPWTTMHTTPSNINLGSWDDFDRFVSIEEADLTMPWDDEDIKP